MTYKLVVKTRNETYVKKRSNHKKHLEDLALNLSIKKPHNKYYIVKEDVKV